MLQVVDVDITVKFMVPLQTNEIQKWPEKDDIQSVHEKYIIHVLSREEEPYPIKNARHYTVPCHEHVEMLYKKYKTIYF